MRQRLVLVSLLLLGGLAGGIPASGSPGAVNGRIAYERHGFFGGTEVWTMNQDGSEHRRVGTGREPAWSSDGTRLVMVSEHGQIVLVDEDGSDVQVVEVVHGPQSVGLVGPALSPDGSTIAFGGSDGLYVVAAAGGVPRRIAAAQGSVAPAWSPDGSVIAFVALGPTGTTLYVVAGDGSGLRLIPDVRTSLGGGASWSPDGAWIAYPDYTTGGITAVTPDGLHRRVVTRRLVNEATDPVWSPDGGRIAFVDNRSDICVVNADGTQLGRLTYAPHHELFGWGSANVRPSWQPLPPASPPAGVPVAPSGPPGSWDRNFSWALACSLDNNGRVLTDEGSDVRTHVGGPLTYRLRFANTGSVPIGELGMSAFTMEFGGQARVRSLVPERGACFAQDRPNCRFGSIFPGEHVDVTMRVEARAAGELWLRSYLPYPASGQGTPPEYDLLLRARVDRCTIRGTRRGDVLVGSRRRDVLCGLEGHDRLRPGAGPDLVHAGPGNDAVDIRDRRKDFVWCGDGADVVTADRGDVVAGDCERVRRY